MNLNPQDQKFRVETFRQGPVERDKGAGLEIDPKFHAARFNLALSHLAEHNKADTMKQYFVIKNSSEEYARRLYNIINQDKVIYVGQR